MTIIARPAPSLSDRTREFWQSGADGVLSIARCGACGNYTHPPLPLCPKCHRYEMRFEPVSGRGTIYAWTLNHYRWSPEMEPPYILAEIELIEQKGLRMMSTVVNAEPDQLEIGMNVTVSFDRSGETWIPVFNI